MPKYLLLILALVTTLAAAPEYPKMGPDIYDTHANGSAEVAQALTVAQREHKRVLVMFGANWCIWCRRLHTVLTTNPEVTRAVREHYELVLVDVNKRHGSARNADLDARYGHPTRFGVPVLVVLDADGKLLTTQDTGELEDGRSAHDPHKVLAFLDRWKS